MNWNKITFVFACIFLSSCLCGRYDMKGVNIPEDVETFSVDLFSNRATIVNPNLAIGFTEKLKTKFQTQTKLGLVQSAGDYEFSGSITEYKIEPVILQNNNAASKNRLTIAISVSFACQKHPEKNQVKTYTFYSDFDASANFSSIEDALVAEITDNIVQQIFSAVALDW